MPLLTLLGFVGFVCHVEAVLFPSAIAPSSHVGCCNAAFSGTNRYSCDTCDSSTSCCRIYEQCVSCCMSPRARPFRRDHATQNSELIHLHIDDRDSFALCQAVCRTGGTSVEHENAYRHPRHHCYGTNPPPLDSNIHKGLFDFVRPIH